MGVGLADDGVIAGTIVACAGLIAGKPAPTGSGPAAPPGGLDAFLVGVASAAIGRAAATEPVSAGVSD